jgi:hypothetical protein
MLRLQRLCLGQRHIWIVCPFLDAPYTATDKNKIVNNYATPPVLTGDFVVKTIKGKVSTGIPLDIVQQLSKGG